jgi:hypothetical protein
VASEDSGLDGSRGDSPKLSSALTTWTAASSAARACDVVAVANATRFSCCAFGTGSDWPTESYFSYLRVRLVPQEILEPMDIVLAVLHV